MLKKVIKYMFIIIICLSLISCKKDDYKEFKGEDFSIKLPKDFRNIPSDSFTYYYKSGSTVITIIKEDFESLSKYKLDSNSTTEEYLKVVSSLNNKNYEITNKENYSYLVYDTDEFYHMTSSFKSSDSFWLVNYFCLVKDKDKYKDEFIKWNDSIEI